MNKPASATNNLPKIAIFASGFGSNFEAIVNAVENHEIEATIACLVVDKPDCFAVQRAINHNIKVISFNPKDFESKMHYESMLVEKLLAENIQLIVLAGYMRIIGDTLLQSFHKKIINIHPALLPAFPGKHGIADAYNYGVKVFGVTVHFVDNGIDTGEIIDQEAFKMKDNQSIDDVETQIHTIEHRLYPRVIKQLLSK